MKLKHLTELDLSGSSYSNPDFLASAAAGPGRHDDLVRTVHDPAVLFEVPSLRHFTLGSSVDLRYADCESRRVLWWETSPLLPPWILFG